MLGEVIGGRYRIVRNLGGGGFGQTYLSEDQHLPGQPQCVVKKLMPRVNDPRAFEVARRLFNREAEVLYTLGNHDQIPRLFAHFEEDRQFYLVQQYVEGIVLNKALKPGHALTERQIIELICHILEVLTFVHNQQVIHRDIKPSNLIQRKSDDAIVMIDFGGVKQIGVDTVNSEASTVTVAIGSSGYMPNEQLAGKPRFSSDIYAVGMVAIQALTGNYPSQLPEDLRTGEILWRDRAPHVSDRLAGVLDKMIRYDFRQRYQSATETWEALHTLTHDSPGVSTGVPPQTAHTSHQQPQPNQGLHTLGINAPLDDTSHFHAPPAPLSSSREGFPSQSSRQSESPISGKISEKSQAPESQALESQASLDLVLNTSAEMEDTIVEEIPSTRNPHSSGQPYSAAQPCDPPSESPTSSESPISSSSQASFESTSGYLIWYERADELFQQQRYQKAAESYKSVLQIKSNDYVVWFKYAISLENCQKYNDALDAYTRVVEINDQDYLAWFRRAKVLETLHRYQDTIESYNKVIQIQPDNYWAWHDKGHVLELAELYEDAIKAYDRAVQLKADFQLAVDSRKRLLQELKQIDRLYHLQHYEEAIASCDEIIKENPEDALAWLMKGMALENSGQYKLAIKSYNRLLRIQPDDHLAWFKRGTLLEKLGLYADAAKSYRQVTKLQPENCWAWSDQGRAYETIHQYERALESYDQALKVRSDFSSALEGRKRVIRQIQISRPSPDLRKTPSA
ncbi:MAG: serine/threonine-protein kinase, partial [Elainellaceae cyanobacterium]